MRYVLIIIILLFAVTSRGADDKALHFGVSTLFGAGAQTVVYHKTELSLPSTVLLGTVAGSVPGLCKELIDENRDDNDFCFDDMAADVAGAFAGALLSGVVNHAVYFRVRSGREQMIVAYVRYEF